MNDMEQESNSAEVSSVGGSIGAVDSESRVQDPFPNLAVTDCVHKDLRYEDEPSYDVRWIKVGEKEYKVEDNWYRLKCYDCNCSVLVCNPRPVYDYEGRSMEWDRDLLLVLWPDQMPAINLRSELGNGFPENSCAWIYLHPDGWTDEVRDVLYSLELGID